MYHYKIRRMRGGSDKFGPCEICGEHCDTTYYQVETRDYHVDDRTRQVASELGVTLSGRTHADCTSYWGHEACLAGKRRTDDPARVTVVGGAE
jgi:hypothetical protein